jgi:DNA-binding response OmpR family regulator
MLRVLIVEDEPELRDNLMIGLSAHGFEVRGVGDGVAMDDALAEQSADLVVLDLGLPGEDGLEIAKRLRGRPQLGVIMVTARGMNEECIRGLESGADSYLVKPVDISLLAAALMNLGRRLARPAAAAWRFNRVASRLHTPNGSIVSLTAQECSLLALLFASQGSIVTRPAIFAAIGQPDELCSNSRLEVLISRLRSKVGRIDPEHSLPLRARHNMGYVFLVEDEE